MFAYYAYICLSAFLFSLLGTRLMIVQHKMRPTGRKLSGISLIFTLIVFMLILDAPANVLSGMAILAALGFSKDWVKVPRFVGIVTKLLVISVCLQFSGLMTYGTDPLHWVEHIILLGIWFGIIHLFERADGIDGMACSWFIAVATVMIAIGILTDHFGNVSSSYGLIAATAALGFVWWNWPPAKIALGEAGRLSVGFLLGFFVLLMMQEGYFASAVIMLAYFLGDFGLTNLQRHLRKDKSLILHYQRALRSGRMPQVVVRYVIGMHILLAFLAANAVINPENALIFAVFAYILVLIMLWWFATTGPKHDTAI